MSKDLFKWGDFTQLEQRILDMPVVIDPLVPPDMAYITTGRTSSAVDQQLDMYKHLFVQGANKAMKSSHFDSVQYTAFYRTKYVEHGASTMLHRTAVMLKHRNGTFFHWSGKGIDEWFQMVNHLPWPVHTDYVPKEVQAMALIF